MIPTLQMNKLQLGEARAEGHLDTGLLSPPGSSQVTVRSNRLPLQIIQLRWKRLRWVSMATTNQELGCLGVHPRSCVVPASGDIHTHTANSSPGWIPPLVSIVFSQHNF